MSETNCSESELNALLWRDISTAPKDGTKIIGWFVPNEVDAPSKAKPWITWWEMRQWRDGNGKKVGEPFGMWVTKGWKNPMSFAPTRWAPAP